MDSTVTRQIPPVHTKKTGLRNMSPDWSVLISKKFKSSRLILQIKVIESMKWSTNTLMSLHSAIQYFLSKEKEQASHLEDIEKSKPPEQY